MRSPSVASIAAPCCQLGLFGSALGVRSPVYPHFAAWPFRQCLAYVLALTCAVLQHHAVHAPAPAKSTASVELASMTKGAMAAELEALEHSAGVGSERGAQKPTCPWVSGRLMLPPSPLSHRDAVGGACGFDERGCRHRRDMGDDDDDWDSRFATSVTISVLSWASSSLGRVQNGVTFSGSTCGTIGSEGGGCRETAQGRAGMP